MDGADNHAPARASGRLIARRGLFDLLDTAGRVTLVSAPAGSGKSSLVRSWVARADLAQHTAWVTAGPDDRDPQSFWLAVIDALRGTGTGSELVREVTASPEIDGWVIIQRLLEDLSSLEQSLVMVFDDLHELHMSEALHQLELLLRGAPAELRFVLLTRSDLRLGLHRLRLEEQITEIRAADLSFEYEEARELLAEAGVELSDRSLQSLLETTEGWAAGLRLAALSLARHPDPEFFATGFSGRERTVAEYLLSEILERQPEEVGRLLLRTSVLGRVNGALADRILGGSGSERILAELEAAGAFVVALDAERSWFRYHRLFADLLALELRRRAPEELPGIHFAAAEWFAEQGFPIEAIRHAQAAENWGLAARLLADHWFAIYLDGRSMTSDELLAGFPPAMVAEDAEFAVLAAVSALARGSLDDVERCLSQAARGSSSVPEDRHERFQLALSTVRLWLARARNDTEGVTEEARRLLSSADASPAIPLGLGEDLRALALNSLGIAEIWTGRLEAAERHLEAGMALARRIERPLLELQALSHLALVDAIRSHGQGEKRARDAVALARKHGWEERAVTAGAYLVLGSAKLWRGRLEHAEPWLDQAERAVHRASEPAAALMLHASRGVLEFALGRHDDAMAAFRAAERTEGMLAGPHVFALRARAERLMLRVQRGEIDQVELALYETDVRVRETPEMQIVLAALKLAQHDPEAATTTLEPILHGSGPPDDTGWRIYALLLQAIASDALRDPGATSRALARALELAEPDGLLLPFLLVPTAELLEQHARLNTSHGSLIAEILDVLSGRTTAARPGEAEPLLEPLSESELRVLRYLPSSMQGPEIAAELFVSVNTIRTHMRHLYAKLGVHRRLDAVERARELGLLPPSLRTR